MSYRIRKAEIQDSELILTFITELAKYEQLEKHVTATVEDINNTLFCPNPQAEVLILEDRHEAAGFVLYFHNYSTFLCRYGIYIEDLYIRAKYRGKGYGKALLKHVCSLALQRGCGRVEWSCLDWNKPSIDFYLSLGAIPMQDWRVYRLNREKMEKLAVTDNQ